MTYGGVLVLDSGKVLLPAVSWWTEEDEFFLAWCRTNDGRTLLEYQEAVTPSRALVVAVPQLQQAHRDLQKENEQMQAALQKLVLGAPLGGIGNALGGGVGMVAGLLGGALLVHHLGRKK